MEFVEQLYKYSEQIHIICERSMTMSKKKKLTPKDVLYISDVLNQLSSYNAELSDDLSNVKDKALKKSINSITEGFSEQFNSFKTILKEAGK